MNTNILNKCIEELKKEAPDLSYLRGMLETLMEMQTVSAEKNYTEHIKPYVTIKSTQVPAINLDVAAILDAKAKMALETIKTMGGEQTE